MKTRREVLKEHHTKFQSFCKEHFPNIDLIPKLSNQELDMSDLVFVITYNFSPHYQNHDKYIDTILMFTSSYGISVSREDLEKHKSEIGGMLDEIILFIKNQKC